MSKLPVWRVTNSWREIFARIFEGIVTEFNANPEWLVNPVTKRRLKLDMFYPDIGVAVRFEGLQGKHRRARPSLEEEAQQQVRREARVEICLQHDIHLIVVVPAAGESTKVFQQIDTALSRAGQIAPTTELKRKIKTARGTATSLSLKITQDYHFKLYADLWIDRQYKISEPATSQTQAAQPITFTEGMEVEHMIFGPGVVLSTTVSNDDTLITVDFFSAGLKTLAASLVVNKLTPR